jgi:hypothetical protein
MRGRDSGSSDAIHRRPPDLGEQFPNDKTLSQMRTHAV